MLRTPTSHYGFTNPLPDHRRLSFSADRNISNGSRSQYEPYHQGKRPVSGLAPYQPNEVLFDREAVLDAMSDSEYNSDSQDIGNVHYRYLL